MLAGFQALLSTSASRTLLHIAVLNATSEVLASFLHQKFSYIACLVLRVQKVLIIGISLLTNGVYTIKVAHLLDRAWTSPRAPTVLVVSLWCSSAHVKVTLPHW